MTNSGQEAPVADIRAAVDERRTRPQHLPKSRLDFRLVTTGEEEQVNPIPIREIDAKPNTVDGHDSARFRTREAAQLPGKTLQAPPMTQPRIQPKQGKRLPSPGALEREYRRTRAAPLPRHTATLLDRPHQLPGVCGTRLVAASTRKFGARSASYGWNVDAETASTPKPPFTCDECGSSYRGERGWRAYRTREPDGVAVFCPACAAREFDELAGAEAPNP